MQDKLVVRDLDTRYENAVSPMDAFGDNLQRLIGQLLQASNIKPHSIVYRVKSKTSTFNKLGRGGGKREIDSLTDILGLRVITYFKDEVDAIAKVINQEFSIDLENSIDKRATLDPDQFGYLSLHYVAELSNTRTSLLEYSKFAGIKFELQIRSILQHAWAEIEHDLGYKSEAAVPRDIRRRFSRLAGLLEIADDEFSAIKTVLSEHQSKATREIEQGHRETELDRDSLTAFILINRYSRELDEFLSNLDDTGIHADVNPKYVGRRALELSAVGFQSIGDIEDYLKQDQALLRAFARRWFNDDYPEAREIAVPDPSQWEKGASMLYVFLLKIARIAAGETKRPIFEEVVAKLEGSFTLDYLEDLPKAYHAAKADV